MYLFGRVGVFQLSLYSVIQYFGNVLALKVASRSLPVPQPVQCLPAPLPQSSLALALVALRWRAKTTPSADYGVEITLLDENGEPVASANRTLLSAEIKLTSEWEPGQEELNYYSFPGLPIPALGEYSIEVSLYPIDVDSDLDSPTPAAEGRINSVIGRITPSVDVRD